MANKEVLDYLDSMRQAYTEAVEEELTRVEMIRLQREAFLGTGESKSLMRRMRRAVIKPIKLDRDLIDIYKEQADKLGMVIQGLEEGDTGLVEDYFVRSIIGEVQAISYASIDPVRLSVRLLAEKARIEMDLLTQLNPEKANILTWEKGILNWD